MEYGAGTVRVLYRASQDGEFDTMLQGDGNKVKVLSVQVAVVTVKILPPTKPAFKNFFSAAKFDIRKNKGNRISIMINPHGWFELPATE